MTNRRRKLTVAALLAGALAVFGLAASLVPGVVTASGQTDTKTPYEETLGLNGQALVDALGLKPTTYEPGEEIQCNATFVETDNGDYCLDGLGASGGEQWDMALRIRDGEAPSPAEREFLKLSQELDALDAAPGEPDEQQREALAEQISALIAQIVAERSAGA